MFTLIYCTCPDAACAENIARHLVSQHLAACVNILPGVTSIYAWQGEIETAGEHLLLIKTGSELFDQVSAAIKSLHPYEVPEIIAVAIDKGSPDYLHWIKSCLMSAL